MRRPAKLMTVLAVAILVAGVALSLDDFVRMVDVTTAIAADWCGRPAHRA